jgi:hypothetical protein
MCRHRFRPVHQVKQLALIKESFKLEVTSLKDIHFVRSHVRAGTPCVYDKAFFTKYDMNVV